MGKKINCTSTPRGRKSKDQGGGKKSKVVQLYTPLMIFNGKRKKGGKRGRCKKKEAEREGRKGGKRGGGGMRVGKRKDKKKGGGSWSGYPLRPC